MIFLKHIKEFKKHYLFYILIFLLMLIINFNFLKGFASYDTYKMFGLGYKQYAYSTFFADGRVFSAIYILIADFLDIFQLDLYRISMIVSIIIIEIIILYVTRSINKLSNKHTNPYIIFLLCFISIFNFTYVDILKFIESPIIILSILFYIMAAKESILEQNNKKSLIYLLFAVFMYQGTINIFFMMLIYFYILKNKRIDKNFFKLIIRNLKVYVVPIIINILFINIFGYFFISTTRVNINFNNIVQTIYNIFIILKNVIVDTKLIMPRYFYIFNILLILFLVFVTMIKKNKNDNIYIFNCIVLILSSIIVCIPVILLFDIPDINIDGMGGRIFWTIGAIYGLLITYIYIKFDTKKIFKIFLIICVLIYSLILYISMFISMYEYRQSVEFDRNICFKIDKDIEEYENKNNKKIKTYDIKYTITGEGISRELEKYKNKQSYIEACLPIRKYMEFHLRKKIDAKIIYDDFVPKDNTSNVSIEYDEDIAYIHINV